MAVWQHENVADDRAHYSDGQLVPGKTGASADPKPTAGKIGTQITVCRHEDELI